MKEIKKIGKPKAIESPERMLDYFDMYKEDTKANPFIVTDWVGGIGKQVDRQRERPLTLEGFENWLFRQGIITDVSDYFENKDNRYALYLPICRAIKKHIRQDQIEGGMAGIFNPSITQRLNSLSDNVTTTVVEQPLFPDKK